MTSILWCRAMSTSLSSLTPRARFLAACRRKPVDRPPVWMMRQAGRYLPEYREIRKTKTTLEMMKDPDTACTITLQPVERLGVDAAILYSDILIVPEAMGLKLEFVKDHGPIFDQPVQSEKDAEALKPDGMSAKCSFVFETLRRIRKKVGPDYPVIGFAGAPFTVAAYVTGGDGAHEGKMIRQLASTDAKTFQLLMEKLTRATRDYVLEQIRNGADAIQLFDTWAGSLDADSYTTLALPYVRSLFQEIKAAGVPTILYIKGGGPLLPQMLTSGADVISIDWKTDLAETKRFVNGRVALQGNFNPETLYQSPAAIDAAVKAMLAQWGRGPGYIINLGHGILPDIPVEHAQAFVDAAKRYGLSVGGGID